MTGEEYNILSTVMDDTFGKGSSDGSFKCIGKISKENTLTVTCMMVVNLLNRSEMQAEAKKSEDQLNKLCNEYMKRVKSEFKMQAGRALKTKQGSSDMSVELINMSSYSPKGTSLIRQVTVFEIS